MIPAKSIAALAAMALMLSAMALCGCNKADTASSPPPTITQSSAGVPAVAASVPANVPPEVQARIRAEQEKSQREAAQQAARHQQAPTK